MSCWLIHRVFIYLLFPRLHLLNNKKKKEHWFLRIYAMNHKITRINFRRWFNISIYFSHKKVKSLFIKLFHLGMGFTLKFLTTHQLFHTSYIMVFCLLSDFSFSGVFCFLLISWKIENILIELFLLSKSW